MLKDILEALYDEHTSDHKIKKTIEKCRLFLSDKTLININLSQIQSIIYKSQDTYNKHLALYAFIVNQLHSKKYSINDTYFQDLNFLWSYIALFEALKQSDQIIFVSIRIKDPRHFLHPHTDLCTAKYLSSIYNILYWLTRSISQSYLYMAQCSPLSELAVTLSRATLLISGHQSIDNLNKIEIELNNMLFNMGLPIEIMTTYEIINASEDVLIKELFPHAVKNCNKSDITKKEEKTNFYTSHNNNIYDITKPCWNKFNNTLTTSMVLNKSYKYSTSLPIEIISSFNSSKNEFYKVPLLWRKNYNAGDLYNSYIKYFNRLPFSIGRLRLDVGGFLDSMISFGGHMLDLHQTYRSYHEQFFYCDIPGLIRQYQDNYNSVFLMHSVLDDACLIGCISTLEIISIELEKLYEEKYKGRLKCSIEPFHEGYTVADWSLRVLKKL